MANLCASSAVNAVVTEALKAYANHACSGVLQLSVWTNVYNAASACKIILKKDREWVGDFAHITVEGLLIC